MKRVLLFVTFVLCVGFAHAQLEEDFDPAPPGWVLSQGASFSNINGNGIALTPGVGGNNPAVIGTPAVNKTSNTVKICLDIWAYTSNLNSQIPFPCATYMDVLFVKSSVTTSNDAVDPANILARVDNYLLPTNGGTTCFTFTFPPAVTDPSFKVFLSFHADCNQGGVKYVMDNVKISGIDDACAGNGCPPTALDDVFNRGSMVELSFNGAVYGSNLNYPAPPAGYVVDATGTDNDQNDTYAHVKWELVTPPSNGTVVLNADGTFTATRNSPSVTQMIFFYRMCDDGADDNIGTTGDNLCDDAKVTINWPSSAITPVSLINFTAGRNGSTVTLKWTTTFESNNKGFEIQRSIGTEGYVTVGFVATKAIGGNSTVPVQYEYKEMNGTKYVSQYRLVQIDIDGTRKFSAIKAVRGQDAVAKMILYPNPSTNGNVTALFSNANERDIVITDLSGKKIKQWLSYTNDNLSITGLGAGVYVLSVNDKISSERSVEKIVVVKQ